MSRAAVLCALLASSGSALQLSSAVSTCPRVQPRAVQPKCVAATDGEKAVIAASQKVTLAAKRFGPTQGKAAQAWVESAIKTGDASGSSLMQMQLTLFEECQVDDETGRCKDLSDAIDALTASVADRKATPKDEEFKLIIGPTPIQEAATKLRTAATSFGPEQKAAADAWIKKLTSGQETNGLGLLEEQVALFGECVLSEDSTPSNCQALEEALAGLQAAIDTCSIDSDECSPEEAAAAVAAKNAGEPAEPGTLRAARETRPTGVKRKAIKKFFRKLTGANKLSPMQVASLLAAPADAGVDYAGKTTDELVALLEEEGVPRATIDHALVSVLPFMPGQEKPGIDSLEVPK